MLKTFLKILAVAVLLVALLGGFDATADAASSGVHGASASVHAQPATFGVVGTVSADTCPDGGSGCHS